MKLTEKLSLTEQLINKGLDVDHTWAILDNVLHAANYFEKEDLADLRLYAEYMPKAVEIPLSPEQKYAQLLWESLDKTPLSTIANFAIPFRRLLAQKLFKSCGKALLAEENIRFHFPSNIALGDNVFLNRGAFLDGKGGIIIGSHCLIGEGVSLLTHSHSESSHQTRAYAPIHIEPYVKIYSFATILPGVRIKTGGIVAIKALVNKEIAENSVVAGTPAKELRMRNTGGKTGAELAHVWLHNGGNV